MHFTLTRVVGACRATTLTLKLRIPFQRWHLITRLERLWVFSGLGKKPKQGGRFMCEQAAPLVSCATRAAHKGYVLIAKE